MKIRYARFSTKEQSQIVILQKHGCKKIFSDHASGVRVDRPV